MAKNYESRAKRQRSKTIERKARFQSVKKKPSRYRQRYGNIKQYKIQCAIAHKSVHGLCCSCLTKRSEELHHAKYGQDSIGHTVFPVCKQCHQIVCHSQENWIVDHKNPVWESRNTEKFLQKLQLGYQLLYEGINHAS